MPDDTCSDCQRPLELDAFGFLCRDCRSRNLAIAAAHHRHAARQAAHLRSLGLHPALHRDNSVAHAERRAIPRDPQAALDLSDLPGGAR